MSSGLAVFGGLLGYFYQGLRPSKHSAESDKDDVPELVAEPSLV